MKEKKGGNFAATKILIVAVITGIVASSVPPVRDLDLSIAGLRAWSALILISVALLYLKAFFCGFISEALKALGPHSRLNAPHQHSLPVHVADCVFSFILAALAFYYCARLYPDAVTCSSFTGLVVLGTLAGIGSGVINYIHSSNSLETAGAISFPDDGYLVLCLISLPQYQLRIEGDAILLPTHDSPELSAQTYEIFWSSGAVANGKGAASLHLVNTDSAEEHSIIELSLGRFRYENGLASLQLRYCGTHTSISLKDGYCFSVIAEQSR